jgi:hypothetical protein
VLDTVVLDAVKDPPEVVSWLPLKELPVIAVGVLVRLMAYVLFTGELVAVKDPPEVVS